MPYKDLDKQKIAQHESYVRNKPRYIARQRQTREEWRKKIRKHKKIPCMDCGIAYPYYIMQFDHRDRATKLGTINFLGRFSTWQQIEEEIKKCDVVCANCHAERTYQYSIKHAPLSQLVEETVLETV